MMSSELGYLSCCFYAPLLKMADTFLSPLILSCYFNLKCFIFHNSLCTFFKISTGSHRPLAMLDGGVREWPTKFSHRGLTLASLHCEGPLWYHLWGTNLTKRGALPESRMSFKKTCKDKCMMALPCTPCPLSQNKVHWGLGYLSTQDTSIFHFK